MTEFQYNIAYNYVNAVKHQDESTQALNQAFCALGSLNQVLSLCEPISAAYTQLVQELLTPKQFSWLEYWMFECDYGTTNRYFAIDNKSYQTQDMTLYKFLEVISQ